MEAVKRIEIVIPEVALGELIEMLKSHRTGGYTVTRGLVGFGDRGPQLGDGLAGEFNNAAVLVVLGAAEAPALLEDLRPLLKRFGGLGLLSDAQSLKH